MHPTLILLPVAVYGLLTFCFLRRADVVGLADAIIRTHLVVFGFLAISTEVLSSVNAITFDAIVTAWSLALSICSLAAIATVRRKDFIAGKHDSGPTDPWSWMFLTGIGLLLASTLVTALVYPPNTWDSMTYHLPRVMHWISNESIAFYPTSISRQNYQMPLAEFAILHLQVLTGEDTFANLVQWTNFNVLICLGAVTAVTLGLGRRQQILSAMLTATLPMAVLQASGTKNDLVVSAFVMTFALFLLRLRREPRPSDWCFAALALGLALLTKGTAYVYCAAVGIVLAAPILAQNRRPGVRLWNTSLALGLVVLFAMSLSAGHLWRNHQLYKHPFSTERSMYQNADWSFEALFGNIVKNLSLHLGTPFKVVNSSLEDLVSDALGPNLDDPDTTHRGLPFAIPYSRYEDTAGNLLHTLVALAGLVLLPVAWRRRHHPGTMPYAVATVSGALLYCWVLKWQPWASRLHTPMFVMASPLLAMTITSLPGEAGKRVARGCGVLLLAYGLVFGLANKTRSLVSLDWDHTPRMDLYFQNRYELYYDYRAVMEMVMATGEREVGLYLGSDDWEYPFWAFARATGHMAGSVAFKHVGVDDVSRVIANEPVLPAYVIATRDISDWAHNDLYTAVYSSGRASLFTKAAR